MWRFPYLPVVWGWWRSVVSLRLMQDAAAVSSLALFIPTFQRYGRRWSTPLPNLVIVCTFLSNYWRQFGIVFWAGTGIETFGSRMDSVTHTKKCGRTWQHTLINRKNEREQQYEKKKKKDNVGESSIKTVFMKKDLTNWCTFSSLRDISQANHINTLCTYSVHFDRLTEILSLQTWIISHSEMFGYRESASLTSM